MSKPGNYTAYQQYKPQDNGTIQAIQHWSNFAEQKRQNDINNEQRDRQLKNQEDKEQQQQIDKWLSYDSIPMTGVENVDMAHAKIVAADRAELQKLVGQLVNVDKFSEKGIALQMQIDKIQKNPAVIKGMVSAPLKLAQEYISGVGTKYVKTPENDNFFSNLKDAKFTRNENGDPAFIIKDPKDDTKEIVLTESEILNLQQVSPLIPMFNWEKMIKDNAEILNKKPHSKQSIDPQSGYLITEEGYDDTTVATIAKNMFSDDKGKPTEYAISFLAQKGIHDIKNLPEGELQRLEQQFITDITPFLVNKDGIKPNTNRIQEKKLDATIANNQTKANQKQQEINQKAKIAVGTGKVQDRPNPNVDFVTKSDKNGKLTFGVNIAENKFSIINKNEDVKVEQQIRDITIDPENNGKVIISGTIYEEVPGDYSGKKPVKNPFTLDSDSDLAEVEKVAAHLGMNRQQLYDLIKNRVPKAKTTNNNKNKGKAKETPQERIARLKREKGLK